MDIPIEAKVLCTDGPGGKATHVIVHPAKRRVTPLVVKEGRSPRIERLVPFRLVEDASAQQIRLRCSQQELSRLPTFLKTTLVESSPVQFEHGFAGPESICQYGFHRVKTKNIPEDELVMDADTKVRSADGPVGRLGELLVDPVTGSITHLGLRKGHIWAQREVMVPVSEVDRIGDRRVHLRMNQADIEALSATTVRRRLL